MYPDASICRCVTPPDGDGLPVSINEAKEHLRVDGADEDTFITSCIGAATSRTEQECRRAFLRQQWTAYIKDFSAGGTPVELPRPNLLTGEGNPFLLEYRDTEGAWHAHTDYLIQEFREPALLWLTEAPADVDAARSPEDAVWRATYWSGYGVTSKDIPQPIRHAILLLTAHFFENRELVQAGRIISEIPKSLDWILTPYRVAWRGGV